MVFFSCDTLHKKMSTMCIQAGMQEHKTNHSLTATSTMRMYKKIQERIGLRSFESLCCYEKTSDAQHKTVSNILSKGTHKTHQPSTSEITHYSVTTDAGVHQQQSVYITPGFSFQNLHGCTINIINSTPPQAVTCSTQLLALNTYGDTCKLWH